MADFVIKRNDLDPAIEAQLLNADGTPLDLTGRTVKFIMRLRSGSSPKVNANATIASATDGQVSYSWTGTDTDTSGSYIAEWETTLAGRKQTIPSGGYLTIDIVDDLA